MFSQSGETVVCPATLSGALKGSHSYPLFCALRAFVELELRVWQQQLGNWYELQRHLYQDVARQFILQSPLMGQAS